MINARKQEHLASLCVWGACGPSPGPGSGPPLPTEGCLCPRGAGDSPGRPPGAPAASGVAGTQPGMALQVAQKMAGLCVSDPSRGPMR